MEPSPKAKELEEFIENTFGIKRTDSIKSMHCIKPPIGCGKEITGFPDELSKREYVISGLCPECQKKVFGY